MMRARDALSEFLEALAQPQNYDVVWDAAKGELYVRHLPEQPSSRGRRGGSGKASASPALPIPSRNPATSRRNLFLTAGCAAPARGGQRCRMAARRATC